MKKFYTDRDIEDLFRSGIKSLCVNDDIVLTDLAYEKAKRLGLQLIFDGADTPPLAPVRPYLSSAPPRPQPKVDSVSPFAIQTQTDVAQRIRSAVISRLGDQVDAVLLDSIIQRVLKATGIR
jgi:hypothetical protein